MAIGIDLDLLTPDLVFFNWAPTTPQEVFELLSRELVPLGLAAPSWRDAVGDRERVFPTGLQTASCGIALPHADAAHVRKPFIAVVHPNAAVPFEPMGGMGAVVKAKLIIALGFNHADDQIGALQHLMGVFGDEARGRAALEAKDPNTLIDILRG